MQRDPVAALVDRLHHLGRSGRPSSALVIAAVWASASRGSRISSVSRWPSSRARSSRMGSRGYSSSLR